MRQEHAEALIRHFQYCMGDLEVDGILGPKTKTALDKHIEESRSGDPMLEAWESAMRDVGKGGDPGANNVSDYIRNLRIDCSFPVYATGPWCAIFASWHLRYAGIDIKSRGAYRLCDAMAGHSAGFEVEPKDMEVDRVYLACWRRARWASHREAHVRFVCRRYDGKYDYIAGNESGDKVRHIVGMSPLNFEKKLIMVVGWRG